MLWNMTTTKRFVLWLSLVRAAAATTTTTCGGDFSMAGSVRANRLAKTWREGYRASCDASDTAIHISIDDSTSSTGAARVCGVRRDASPVDVATLTRPMNRLEAVTVDEWRFDCERSTRSTLQIEVGIEGAALATNSQGAAADCIQKLGGLSMDQLRWMYSGLTESQLIQEGDGWDHVNAVPHSDGSDMTRLWSELHPDCEPVEIAILGPATDSSSYNFFTDAIFKARDESTNPFRYTSSSEMEDLIASLTSREDAIAFFNIRFVLSNEEKSMIEDLRTVALQQDKNTGGEDFVEPSLALFYDGLYALSTRLYMNLAQEEASLINVRPFLEYGFSAQGTEDLLLAGFWPIHDWERVVMRTRAQTASGIPLDDIRQSCGPAGREIAIAGSSTVFPVAQIWSAVYQVGCDVSFVVEGGGSSNGAGRVCGNRDRGSPVDIGDMSREWKESEAVESLGFLYDCLVGDTDRSAIQVPVAIDGITVATHVEGAAQECIEILGGLTTDQLRWIYSSYTDAELEESGWDPSSLKNSDRDSSTHLWSELDIRCQRLEVRISGPDDQSGTYEYFQEAVLSDHDEGETFAVDRVLGYFAAVKDEDLVAFLQEHDGAISYFGYSYYYLYNEGLYAVAVENNDGIFVAPTDETIGNGTYNPLARRIYMNLLNDEKTLQDTVPFVSFGLRTESLVPITGYVAISAAERKDLIERLKNAPYNTEQSLEEDGLSTGALVGIIAGSVIGAMIVAGLVAFFLRKKTNKETGTGAPEQPR